MQNYDLKSLFPTFSVIEGYDAIRASTSNQIFYDLCSNYPMFDSIIQNHKDMSNNIGNLNLRIGESLDDDILDDNGKMKSAGRLVDVARQDVQNILIQQNTLYIIGTMTIATLLITAILITKK